jgi:hypothetical protein
MILAAKDSARILFRPGVRRFIGLFLNVLGIIGGNHISDIDPDPLKSHPNIGGFSYRNCELNFKQFLC